MNRKLLIKLKFIILSTSFFLLSFNYSFAQTVLISQLDKSSSLNLVANPPNSLAGQTFQPQSSGFLQSITANVLNLNTVGTPFLNIKIYSWNGDINDNPNTAKGTLLAVSDGAFPASWPNIADVTWNFSDPNRISLNAGQIYFMEIGERISGFGGVQFWGSQNSTSVQGRAWRQDSGIWNLPDNQDRDIYFVVNAVENKAAIFSPANLDLIDNNITIKGVFDNVSGSDTLRFLFERLDAAVTEIRDFSISSVIALSQPFQFAVNLPNGSYRWKAQLLNPAGIDSNILNFTINGPRFDDILAAQSTKNGFSGAISQSPARFLGQPFKPDKAGVLQSINTSVLCGTFFGSCEHRMKIYSWNGDINDNPNTAKGDLLAVSDNVSTVLSIFNPILEVSWNFFGSNQIFLDPNRIYFMEFAERISGFGDLQFFGSGDPFSAPGRLWLQSEGNWQLPDNQDKDIYFLVRGTSLLVTIDSLQQFKSDATIQINEGQTITEDSVVFSAFLNSSSTSQLRLEVEYTTSMTFTGIANATSSPVNPGSFATVTAQNLQNGSYRWRARAVDVITNAASNWREFGSVGNIDFVVHQVPLYTQVRSLFPSDEETARWFDKVYANGLGNTGDNPCGLFIQNCGCAITSAVMVLRYYGIATSTDNQDINPLTFNNWLSSNAVNGYIGNGNLDWPKVSEYSKDSIFGITRLHYDGRRDIGDNLGTTFDDLSALTDSYVNSAKPVIIWIPSFGHFLVANEKLATTYAVRDPAWYNTKKLDETFTNRILAIRDYNNQFEGVRLYSSFSGPVDGISLNLASPAEFLVTDPQGRRLGKDPISNILYNEIPNGFYGRDGISNADIEIPDSPHIIKNIWIPEPITGSYEVKVLGTASGTYSFNSLIYDASSTAHSAAFSGITATSSETDYTLNHSTSAPQDISIKEVYKFLGFLPPLKTDGTGIYKFGRTLPVKFQLKNANNQFVTNATATLTIAKIQDGLVGTEEIPLSTSIADTGNRFRYESVDDQYIYNLNTGTMSAGTWQLKASLDDGKSYTVLISLRN